MRNPIFASLPLLLTTTALCTGAQVLAPAPPPPPVLSTTNLGFGSDVADAGDVDDDGLSDLAVACGGDRSVRVFSGADRTPLLALAVATSGFSLIVRGAGDVDGDGQADLVVGCPDHSSNRGRVIVYSGRTGSARFLIDGASGDRLGTSVTGLGDVDGDGFDDFAAGAPRTLFPVAIDGLARVYSGANASVLYELESDGVGRALASAGDVDGDGFEELLIGIGDGSGTPGGLVHVVSPHLGSLVRTHQGSSGLRLGYSVAGFGDLNGDGRPDYGAGAPGHDSTSIFGTTIHDSGIVHLWSGVNGAFLSEIGENGVPGSSMGWSLAPGGDVDGDGTPDVIACGVSIAYTFSGASGQSLVASSGTLGQSGVPSAASIADQDGDGVSDFAIGFASEDAPDVNSGSVTIVRADPALLIGLLTPGSDERFGAASALVPDLNGDGLDEVLVGAPFRDGGGADAGAARLHSGADGALLWEVAGAQGDQLGSAVATLGDISGDGIAELLIGVPRDLGVVRSGSARVVSGANGAPLRTHLGLSAGERCGAAVSALGDVNGDGVEDYAVGSPGAASATGKLDVGRVRAYSGATGLLLWTAMPPTNARPARFGSALARVGDVDGDGRSELLVGAPFGSGVELRSGASGALLDVIPAPTGAVGVGARFGAALAGPGDVDGDGLPDLLIGAPGYNAGKGRAWLHSGADGSELFVLASLSLALDENLGAAVAGPGDVDNDGVPDLAVGAPGASIPFTFSRPGAVGIFSGASGAEIRTWRGSVSGERFGASLSSGGDVDGDGLTDLVAGAPLADLDPDHEGHGLVAVPSPRIEGSEHYGAGTPGCAGAHLFTLAKVAFAGGTLELRASGLTPQALPVLWLTFGAFDPGIPVLGGAVLLSVDVTQPLYAAVLPSANGHLATVLPIPNNPAWDDLTFYAQLIQLWPGGCAAIPAPYSSSNGLEIFVE